MHDDSESKERLKKQTKKKRQTDQKLNPQAFDALKKMTEDFRLTMKDIKGRSELLHSPLKNFAHLDLKNVIRV